MEIQEDLSRMATLSSWYNHASAIFTSQDHLFNVGRVRTLTAICLAFRPQTDFEKDVDIACRSGELQVWCIGFSVCPVGPQVSPCPFSLYFDCLWEQMPGESPLSSAPLSYNQQHRSLLSTKERI